MVIHRNRRLCSLWCQIKTIAVAMVGFGKHDAINSLAVLVGRIERPVSIAHQVKLFWVWHSNGVPLFTRHKEAERE